MVTTFYPPYHFGGDAVFLYRLTEALAERGHAVDVIHSVDAYRLQHPAEPEVAFSHHPNVTRHLIQTNKPMLSALAAHQLGRPAVYGRKVRDLLAKGQYDVIHYHNISLMGGPGVLRYGRALKLYTSHEYWLICPTHVLFTFNREACVERKCIRCTLHSRRPLQFWRYTGWVERCLREVDHLITPSRFALEQLRAQGVKCPMQALPYFVPIPPAASEAKELQKNGRPYFLFVGRLEKLKGVQDLIPLFSGYREADLIIVGNGDYAPQLRAQAEGLDHVRFLGAVHPSAIGELYRGAIALLAPSLCYETFGLIAAEAFAHGAPVIARRIGALAEVVEQSGGGYLFDTIEECREKMELLRTEPGLRATLGARGRRAVEENWTAEVHLTRYLALVRSLLAERAETTASIS
ncbi:MAG: glycosyltransferase family 4 protein [Chthoniobacterales bacterium]|nr:glycosyltransferase family 4 protein [Chthoniobacterales bacterium]